MQAGRVGPPLPAALHPRHARADRGLLGRSGRRLRRPGAARRRPHDRSRGPVRRRHHLAALSGPDRLSRAAPLRVRAARRRRAARSRARQARSRNGPGGDRGLRRRRCRRSSRTLARRSASAAASASSSTTAATSIPRSCGGPACVSSTVTSATSIGARGDGPGSTSSRFSSPQRPESAATSVAGTHSPDPRREAVRACPVPSMVCSREPSPPPWSASSRAGWRSRRTSSRPSCPRSRSSGSPTAPARRPSTGCTAALSTRCCRGPVATGSRSTSRRRRCARRDPASTCRSRSHCSRARTSSRLSGCSSTAVSASSPSTVAYGL